ncbi:MAG: PorT family protein [Bacteroidales bacterium]|nr:PorT family protein [Bacteroidales bacterium]
MHIKTNLTLVILLSLPLLMAAQQFDAGIRAGISASQVSGDDLSGYDKPGIYAGIFTSLDISPKSRLTLEMNYIEKGSRKLAKPDEGIYNSYKLMLNYIEVPVTYQYFIHEKLSVELGPSIGVLLKRTDNEVDENGVITDQEAFRKYELAINTNLNYWFNQNWGGGIRHSESIVPVRKHNSRATYWFNRGQHINMLRFFVSYKF